ncbi:MAG: universal stress protein [Balneolaceae bacterium]
MIEIKKILVATDFSTDAEVSYPVAQKIASAFGSTVDFIHVIPTSKYLNESLKKIGVPLDLSRDIYPKIIEEAENLAEHAMDSFISGANRGTYFVKIDRKPSGTIVDHAEENGYDLVIMGARGKHGTKLLRGGTTEKVIRNSKIPVFSIDESFGETTIRNILVPTDTSMLSFAAFPLAAALANTFGSDITFFNVIELYGSASEDIPRNPKKGELVSIHEELIKRLNDYLSDREIDDIHIQDTGVDFENRIVITSGEEAKAISLFTKIEKGISAHYEIERFAEEHSDLVVIATHGHSGFAHLILGSTAEKVAQYISKPVITVPPEKGRL